MLTWCFEDDLPDQSLLDFGNVLEYGAIIHDTSIYHEAIPDDVFPMVLKLIASDNVLRSLLGNRVLQHLLDRNNNRLQFDTPRSISPEEKIFKKKRKIFFLDYFSRVPTSTLKWATIRQWIRSS